MVFDFDEDEFVVDLLVARPRSPERGLSTLFELAEPFRVVERVVVVVEFITGDVFLPLSWIDVVVVVSDTTMYSFSGDCCCCCWTPFVVVLVVFVVSFSSLSTTPLSVVSFSYSSSPVFSGGSLNLTLLTTVDVVVAKLEAPPMASFEH